MRAHTLGILVDLIYMAIIIAAEPDASSVAWVLVAEETKNYWAIALPGVIMFSMSEFENARIGKKNGKG